MADTTSDRIDLPVQLVNAIIGYLVKRPFEEVAGLVQAIQQAAQEKQEN